MKTSIINKIKRAPTTPGVYIFYKNKTPLYVGKASNLKNRLQSYLKITDVKNRELHERANRLETTTLNSSIEALIQEARLIKELKPELNICWRDDKNYFYVAFTEDELSKIFVTHQPRQLKTVGPFTNGQALRLILKILRRRYPYCTCFQPHLRNCLNAQIGLCPGPCCSLNYYGDRLDGLVSYKKNIKAIKNILSGRGVNTLRKIIRPDDHWAMENVLRHSPFLESNSNVKKIECYDISNFAGKEAVGAFTVLVNRDDQWQPDRGQFRKFKIKKTANTRNDPAMIAEILRRRLNHPEWPYPDLIIIDGGITQYHAAQQALANRPLSARHINLVSFAKPHQKVCGPEMISKKVVELAINQTHRYVLNYHRQIRGKI